MKALLRILLLLLHVTGAQGAERPQTATPEAQRRGPEQTYLTFPEWYLVHSPAEYADFVQRDGRPSDFPFIAHVRQFWSSYATVWRATREDYAFNFGYHVMIAVIGSSTSVEYALRASYETLIGRLSELCGGSAPTAEDRFGARVAQDYVDFIRVRPWYEYDFLDKLVRLWTETGLQGPAPLRKWERKYALTTEYGVKAGYAWLIRLATRAAYEVAAPTTTVLLDSRPTISPGMGIRIVREDESGVLADLPRYEAFKIAANSVAAQGIAFREIAGNSGDILLSVIAPQDWTPPQGSRVLFTQPILTRPGRLRVALVLSVATLSSQLQALGREPGTTLEHVYDY